MASTAKHVLSEDELAALAGVSETSWKNHKAAGCPKPKNRADIAAWLKRYHGWRRQNGKVERAPSSASSNGVDAETTQHKRELWKLRAKELKIEIARQEGELLSRKDVIDYASAAVLAVNNGLDAAINRVVSRLGPLCQGGETHVEEVLRAEIDHLRERFSKGMHAVHEQQGGA